MFDIGALKSGSRLYFGLPLSEAIAVCKERVQKDIARLAVQIAAPDVVQLKRDVTASFSDQLGAIGKFKGFRTCPYLHYFF